MASQAYILVKWPGIARFTGTHSARAWLPNTNQDARVRPQCWEPGNVKRTQCAGQAARAGNPRMTNEPNMRARRRELGNPRMTNEPNLWVRRPGRESENGKRTQSAGQAAGGCEFESGKRTQSAGQRPRVANRRMTNEPNVAAFWPTAGEVNMTNEPKYAGFWPKTRICPRERSQPKPKQTAWSESAVCWRQGVVRLDAGG